MKKVFVFILYILSYLTLSSAVNVTCNFKTNIVFTSLGYPYTCVITNNLNITSPEDAVIESISGTHLSGKNNDDVMAFRADSKGIDYFPNSLEKFFKNLKGILIQHGRLKQISQSDLRPHKNLVYLNVYSNDIEILEDDLFKNHPNIKYVLFGANKIFHVGKNVFNNMNNISYMGFNTNPCIDMYTHNNTAQVQVIIESLKSKCFDVTFANFSQNLSNLETESKTLTFETFIAWKENLENLENEFKNSRFSYLLSIKRRFEVLNEIKIDDFTTQNPVTTSTTAITVTTTTVPPNDCDFDDLENNLSELFTKSLNQTENNLKNSFTESCTDVNYQTLYLMKNEFTKIDVQHSSILSDISNLKEKMQILEEKLDKILMAVNGV